MISHPIHEKAVVLAKKYIQTERELIAVLQEIERRRIFADLGYSSMFSYCEKGLGLSDHQTKAFLAVARKCVEIPLLQKALDTGDLNVSQARRILPAINVENSEIWIEKARELPQKQLEQLVVARVPDAAAVEVIKPISESLTRFISDIPHALAEDIERVRELVMREKGQGASLREALDAMTQFFLDRKDPVRKARRVMAKPAQTKKPQALASGETGKMPPNPRYIPKRIEHDVQIRDQGQCRHRDPDGSRCRNRIFLHLHHVKPVAHGGQASVDNLVLLCSNHHSFLHGWEKRQRVG